MDRVDPQLASDERTMLLEFLDFHRATLVQKVTGLTQAQLAARPVSTSSLTLAGLVKHHALNEDTWFSRRFAGLPELEPWASAPFDADPDWEFTTAPAESPESLVVLYEAACERSRAAIAHSSFDDLSAEADRGGVEHFTLRWIVLHMIEETARHNGHVDLMREAIDGTTGE